MKHPHRISVFIPNVKGLLLMFLMAIPMVVISALPNEPQHESRDTAPSPGLEPSEVVRIQVEALRKNTLLNEGIELTYRFASPGNKRYTGSLNRFTEMVRSTPYKQLLNHLKARYGPLLISGNEAYQVVSITDKLGVEVAYGWVLSRQSEGEFEDCWMTEAVISAEQSMRRELVQTYTLLEIAVASSLAIFQSAG